ncbi:MAG: flagellar hook-associated protein FlgK [Oscillospiraceae bacterium]|jgi:flagellar hook-associated protein 1 FlgK|nr:flagellar hook-associated protein FlgK [Oscillospiraceae bacterium]
MRATFFGFEAARKALMVSQRALDVTGQNVSNVNTEGYTRQRVDISSLSLDTGATRYARAKGDSVGQGADIKGIQQIRDQFIDIRYRKESAELGKLSVRLSVLTDIENVLDEISTNGLNERLNDFYNKLQDFSLNAETVEFASIFRSSAQKVAEVFNQYSLSLKDIKEQQVFYAKTDIDDVNRTIKRIAELNFRIKGEYAHGYSPNELLDERNLMLDKLSGLIGADYELKPDGQVSVKLNGTYIIDSEINNKISTLSFEASGYPVSVMLNGKQEIEITSGSIAGYIEGLNGKGIYASADEDGTRGIAYFEQAIDDLAKAFADNFNNINDPSGINLLFVGDENGNITAESIRLSDEWLNDAQFITESDLSSEDGSNQNLLKMLDSMNTKRSITPYFTGTFEEFAVSLIGDISIETEYTRDMRDASEFVLNTIYNQRESIMGVSIDEEAINMVKYQKAYNAAARIMTAMDEMLEVLINRTGIVGR